MTQLFWRLFERGFCFRAQTRVFEWIFGSKHGCFFNWMCLSRPLASCTKTKWWDRLAFQICSILTVIQLTLLRRSVWSSRIHMRENSLKKKTGQSSGSSSLKNVVLLLFLSLPLVLTNSSLLVGLNVSLNALSECSSSDSMWKVLGFGKGHTLHKLELFQVKSTIVWPQKWRGRQRTEYRDYFLLWEKEKPCSLLPVNLVPWVTEKSGSLNLYRGSSKHKALWHVIENEMALSVSYWKGTNTITNRISPGWSP